MPTPVTIRRVFQVCALAAGLIIGVGCSSAAKEKAASDATPPVKPAAAPSDFAAKGIFVETCACKPPCGCEMTGLEHGCKGLGAYQLTGGKYMGTDLAGVKLAYAMAPGEWVRLYVDAKPEQRQAAEAFGKAVVAKFGPLEATKAAAIDIQGADGAYTVTVDGGKIMKYQTEPVLGGDKKTPIGHANVNNVLNPTYYQGQSVSATYKDDNRKFELPAGRNSYFHQEMNAKGKV